MGKKLDITAQKFNRLTAVGFSHMKRRQSYWFFNCDCGNTKVINTASVKNSSTKSCGCLQAETGPKNATRHGMTYSPEYMSWASMKKRCTNENSKDFHRYGARGIKVCSSWLTFENFYNDMGKRPSNKHSIDRIDVNGDYNSVNCRWATREQQNNNTSRNRPLTYNGVTLNIGQWIQQLNIPSSVGCSHTTAANHLLGKYKSKKFGDLIDKLLDEVQQEDYGQEALDNSAQ